MAKLLPEIGQEFKFKGLTRKQLGEKPCPLDDWRVGDIVVVAAHVMMQGEICALYWNEANMSSSTVRPDLLEKVRTPQQIAEEEKEIAADEMFAKFGGPHGLTKLQCIWVISEGYRKQ